MVEPWMCWLSLAFRHAEVFVRSVRCGCQKALLGCYWLPWFSVPMPGHASPFWWLHFSSFLVESIHQYTNHFNKRKSKSREIEFQNGHQNFENCRLPLTTQTTKCGCLFRFIFIAMGNFDHVNHIRACLVTLPLCLEKEMVSRFLQWCANIWKE